MRFSDTVDNPELVAPNYLSALRGMQYDPIASKCIAYTEEVQSFFSKNKCGLGIDLMSLDLMRGRNVGIVPYIKCFEKCAGIRISGWGDLEPYISAKYIPALRQIYSNSVNDIELLVGVLAEKRVYGSYGKIGACILAEQFCRLEFGNRFFTHLRRAPIHSQAVSSYLDLIQLLSFNNANISRLLLVLQHNSLR